MPHPTPTVGSSFWLDDLVERGLDDLRPRARSRRTRGSTSALIGGGLTGAVDRLRASRGRPVAARSRCSSAISPGSAHRAATAAGARRCSRSRPGALERRYGFDAAVAMRRAMIDTVDEVGGSRRSRASIAISSAAERSCSRATPCSDAPRRPMSRRRGASASTGSSTAASRPWPRFGRDRARRRAPGSGLRPRVRAGASGEARARTGRVVETPGRQPLRAHRGARLVGGPRAVPMRSTAATPRARSSRSTSSSRPRDTVPACRGCDGGSCRSTRS